jgi:hypothetical protein
MTVISQYTHDLPLYGRRLERLFDSSQNRKNSRVGFGIVQEENASNAQTDEQLDVTLYPRSMEKKWGKFEANAPAKIKSLDYDINAISLVTGRCFV